jgi:hypothetical protein
MRQLVNAITDLNANFIFQKEFLGAFQAESFVLQASREFKAQSALQKIISVLAFLACVTFLIEDNAILYRNPETHCLAKSKLILILSLLAVKTMNKLLIN